MKKTQFSRILSAATVALLPALAVAQPGAEGAPAANNPPNQNPGGRGGRGGGWGGNTLTDAQRQQLEAQNAQIRDIQQRQSFVYAGITDTAVQDALVAFLKEQEDARQKLREKWQALQRGARDGATTDTQLAALLNTFRNSADDERNRRDKAVSDLDAKIGFSKNPRLEASLLTGGFIGDEQFLVGGGGGGGGNGGFANAGLMGMLGGMFGGGMNGGGMNGGGMNGPGGGPGGRGGRGGGGG